jgi:hypothetical protein
MSDVPDRSDRSRDADGPRKPGGSGGTGAPRGRDGAGGRGSDRTAGGKPRRDAGPRDGQKKPYAPRGGAERKPFVPREGGERKPYSPRAGGAAGADRKPFSPRAGGTGDDRKPFTPRDGERRPFPPRDGERRPPRVEDDRPRHDDPPIPDDIEAKDLDKVARAELKTLSKDNADWVARHLVMAARHIDDDPALAHKHALAAGRRAGRIGVVRETVAITAYATEDFALALRELRTYRRLTGKNDQLPLMVDSERGVGRPDRALELGRSVPRAELDVPVQVELAIAMSGARLDLGQPEAALTELQIPHLDPARAFAWSPALFDAYATVLEELGRGGEAAEWYARSERASEALDEAADPDGEDDTIEIVEEEVEEEPGEG